MTELTLTMKDKDTGKEVTASITTGEMIWQDHKFFLLCADKVGVRLSEKVHLEEGGE